MSSLSYVCCVCQQLIYDHMLYECDRRHFHKTCLKCQACGHAIQPELNDKLYAINGLLVCRQDYAQIRSACRVCGQAIGAGEMRFETTVGATAALIHAKCMSCQSCRQSLERGDRYVLSPDNNRLLCHKCSHFGPPFAPPQPNNGGRRGRKRANNN